MAVGKGRKPRVDARDYRHAGEKRKNIPPAKIAAEGEVPKVKKVRYYYSPHLAPELRFDSTGTADRAARVCEEAARYFTGKDHELLEAAAKNQQPWLEWASKREQEECGWFEVDPVALHIHERVSAQAIIRAAMREDAQRDLFADPELPYQQEVQFYRHDIDWANRLILGDSLQVMSSLARRENMAGQVQMIYIDPPYGIRFGSNFQPEVGKRDVKDKQDDLTREPEMVRAYRDTWSLGVHSYLAYLRERLILARELLADTGSVFVQIGDENLAQVAVLMNEVFGRENAIVTITVKKKSSTTPTASVADYILWYAKKRSVAKILKLTADAGEPEDADKYRRIELPSGERRTAALLSPEERSGLRDMWVRDDYPIVSQDPSATRSKQILIEGRLVSPGINRHWTYDPDVDMKRLERAGRARAGQNSAFGVVYWGDSRVGSVPNVWTDFHGGADPVYVVHTNPRIIERCMLITSEPGDLVLDPTCGGGTTAYVAEQWGRRWITIDTSRVAIAIARQRLLTAKYEHYKLRDESRGPSARFVCKTVPLITLKSIAKNTNLDPILAKHEPILAERLAELNAAFETSVSDRLRQILVTKLEAKIRTEGTRSVTDADERRWLLPGTKPTHITDSKAARWRQSIPPEKEWSEYEVPFDSDPDWPKALQDAVTAYRKAWRAKMDEVNACIAANADQEELVDQPEVVRGVVRVSGPFTVEGVRPEELSLGEEGLFDATPNDWEGGEAYSVQDEVQNLRAYLSRMVELIRKDGVTFPNNKHQDFARVDALFEEKTGTPIHAEGIWQGTDEHEPNGVAIAFGPQYGPVTAEQVEDLIRSSKRYNELVIAGFSFDGEAAVIIQESAHPKLKIHMAHIRPDVSPGMDGLLKDTPNSQLFTVFGQPEIKIRKHGKDEWHVKLLGVDIFDPLKGEVRSTGAEKVAAWFLDSDYDGRCFCITQAFFPDQNAWEKIAKALGSQADLEAFDTFKGTESLPFKPGKYKRIAVKVIDPRGNEVMTFAKLES